MRSRKRAAEVERRKCGSRKADSPHKARQPSTTSDSDRYDAEKKLSAISDQPSAADEEFAAANAQATRDPCQCGDERVGTFALFKGTDGAGG